MVLIARQDSPPFVLVVTCCCCLCSTLVFVLDFLFARGGIFRSNATVDNKILLFLLLLLLLLLLLPFLGVLSFLSLPFSCCCWSMLIILVMDIVFSIVMGDDGDNGSILDTKAIVVILLRYYEVCKGVLQ